MARDVETVLNELLDEGISLTELAAAAATRLEDALPMSVDRTTLRQDTISGHEGAKVESDLAISLPRMDPVALKLPRIEGLPRWSHPVRGGWGHLRR